MEKLDMKNPLVSVCIPAYNVENYVEEALKSVLEQTYSNIEVLVVNDGSIDKTKSILDSYNDSRLKVFHCLNRGAAASRNYALNQSKGKLIKFFDADDIMSQNMIEKQVEVLQGKNRCIASAEWGRFYDDKLETFKLNPERVWKNMHSTDWVVNSLKEGFNMMQPGIFLIPKRIIDQMGGWNEKLSLIDDFEYMLRILLNAEEIHFTSGARLFYRSGISESLSRQKSRKAMESAYLSTELGCQYILEKEDSQRTRKVCANIWQQRVFEFYPAFKDLVMKAEKHITNLDNPTVSLPAGPGLSLLSKLIGWKAAKTIHHFYYQKGFRPLFK
ncbi:glycosyltransferase involved in cell wall biosynthesis [Catalinimonas alkaloidigena]|uniref:glycosyltransferase family 2 protein n=1 Tax=Catalinimonas alkaloidigena TaxID=1075417 RepID=UPI0024066820|nr:glycosyltransferase family 2 protein [Catalinimonas alkaloidigena]MDF9798360.1 glycosyltransferase involved in cell wall biosynthesis [Catalinimonas alkaloidigena]